MADEASSISKLSRISYDKKTNTLLLKLVSFLPHQEAMVTLEYFFLDQINQTGLWRDVTRAGSTTFPRGDVGTMIKEADRSWLPSSQVDRNWPSIVLEAGFAEFYGRLEVDARHWLENSDSQVEIVVTIAIHRSNPCITIEKWERESENTHPNIEAVSPDHGLARKAQEVTISRLPNNIIAVNGSLTTRFEKIFLRPRNPANMLEQDVTFSQQNFQTFAQVI